MKILKTKKIIISAAAALLFGAQLVLAGGVPQNVTGVEATPLDESSIGLSWNSALDGDGGLVDHYRIYYGTFSVFEAGEGDYESEVDTPSNETEYVVMGLEPDTTYYFSVTAISSDALESEEYSYEASGTTSLEDGEGEGGPEVDTTPPTVTGVTAPDKLHVKLVFSEAVKLPAASPEAAFSIVEQINPTNTLTVVSAVIDPADATGKTVLMETSAQTPSINYIITAGVAMKDLADNPIVSGSTDSGLFLGSNADPAPAEEPVEEPEEVVVEPVMEAAAEVMDCEEDMECFLPYVAIGAIAKVVQSDETHEYELEIISADATDVMIRYTAKRHPNILFGNTDMDCVITMKTYTLEEFVEAFDLDNCSGVLVDGYEPVEIEIEEVDVTPPENITDLLLSYKAQLEKFTVMLTWNPSANTAKDLVDQILYMSLDRGNQYDTGKSLGPSVSATDVESLEAGTEYTFKITTKDDAGNESTGVIKSIRLPQTGMGVGLLLILSVYGAGRALRRRK
jgi:hypothetical protein